MYVGSLLHAQSRDPTLDVDVAHLLSSYRCIFEHHVTRVPDDHAQLVPAQRNHAPVSLTSPLSLTGAGDSKSGTPHW